MKRYDGTDIKKKTTTTKKKNNKQTNERTTIHRLRPWKELRESAAASKSATSSFGDFSEGALRHSKGLSEANVSYEVDNSW